MKNIKNLCFKLISMHKSQFSLINILLLYRYLSFLITLVLFYTTSQQKQVSFKFGIILGLIIAYTTMALLYYKNQNDKKRVLLLSIVETIENSLFIIISGGFSSPFIWYFISTVFITAVNISYLLAYTFSAVYFITAALSTINVLNSINNYDVIRLYLNTAISCIIVVVVILQLIRYAIKLEDKSKNLAIMNYELAEAKIQIEKTLRYSIDIYETINLFQLQKNDNILQELIKQFEYLTGIKQLIFIRLTPEERYGTYAANGLSADEISNIYEKSMDLMESNPDNTDIIYYKLYDKTVSINYVMYEHTPCGAFITLTDKIWDMQQPTSNISYNEGMMNDKNGAFSVFIKLVGIILKKLEIDELEEQLVVSEEQNRIANEIHDIVLQKLFAISCKLYVLELSQQNNIKVNMEEELCGIKESIDLTVKELREAIYNYSWEKQGEDTFVSKLTKYAEDIRYMHDIDVRLCITGDTQKVKANQKRDLYRIICEAMNNAIRHGKAKHINVNIIVEEDSIVIRIIDDGEGFDIAEYSHDNEKGLGLNNIYRIVNMLSGRIDISSCDVKGTEILMAIPYRPAA